MDEKRDLTKELAQCQRHLTQLCADIEPEFLQLGRGLESIFQRAQDLSEQARGAVYLHATAHLREEGQTSAPGGHLRKVTDLFLDVRDIFNTSLDALRTTIEESVADFIQGMARQNEGFIIILDINRILSIDEITLMSAAGGPGIEADVAVQKIPGDVHAEMVV